jgi:hypothetical protein
MTNLQTFFTLLYQYVPNPGTNLVAWGSVTNPLYLNPLYLTINELLEHGLDGVPQDRDMFFTPAVLRVPRRTKSNVSGAGVVWVDRDGYKNGQEQFDPLLPPTAIVRSGRGEHLYWILDSFYKPEDVERANKVLLSHLQLQPESWDRARLLRVPGSQNCKYLQPDKYPDYKEALPCELIELHPDLSYNINDLLRLQPYEPELLATPTNGSGEVDRSRRDYKLVCRLMEWELADYAIETALLHHSPKAEDRPEDYVQLTIEKAKESLISHKVGDTNSNTSAFNASLTPVARLFNAQGQETALAIEIVWDGHKVMAAATPLDFLSKRAVNQWLESSHAGLRSYSGTDKNLMLLFQNMVMRCPDTRQLQVTHAGRYDLPNNQRVFIYGRNNEVLTHPDADIGAFWQPRIDVNRSLDLSPDPLKKEQAEHILTTIQQVQVPGVLQPALGWLFIAPFNTLLKPLKMRLPILLLFGFAGSGKTSLVEYGLLPLLGLSIKPTAADATTFSLLGSMTLSHSWPTWIGEYRATNANVAELHRLLREVYDQSSEPRGTPQQQVISHDLVSPVIVDGENPFPDGANAGRAVMLRLDKANIDIGKPANKAFQTLLDIDPKWFKQFAYTYLRWTLTKDQSYLARKLKASRILFQELQQAREAANYAVVWAGLLILRDFITEMGWEVEIGQDFDAFIEALTYTFTMGLGVRTEVDELIEHISHFAHIPDLGTAWDNKTRVLWFSLPRAVRALRINISPTMLKIQLSQRLDTYLCGPEQRGGSVMWGIDIAKARELGLDVQVPREGPIQLEADNEGNVK